MTDMTSIGRLEPGPLELGSPAFPELEKNSTAAPEPPGADPVATSRRKGGGRIPFLLWGLGWFLLGIGFWHAVGFWSFVETAFFGEGDEGAIPAIMAEEPIRQKRPEVPACTALVLDRERNITYSRPCEIGAVDSIRVLPLRTTYRISRDVIRR